MAVHQVAEEDFKRRARRRLMGAVSLTIIAVIILPLVLDKEPPPAGPLNIQMPVNTDTTPSVSAPVAEVKSLNTEEPKPVPEAAPLKTEATNAESAAQKLDEPAHPASQVAEKSSGKDGQYAVQVGAFADAANVNRIKSRIQSLGLPAYTDRLGNTTRVRAGPFKDRATAEKAAVKLAAAGLPVKLDGP